MATTPSPRKPGSAGYLPTLDGWRTIAIGLVLLHHGAESAGVSEGGWVGRLVWQGGFGVQVFFAISGYLITSKLVQELGKRGRISLGDFYKRRMFRIYPASLTYVAVLVVLKLAGLIYLSSRHVVAAVFCFANYGDYVFPGAWTWYLGHFWSLSVEEHYYFVWPALLALLGFRKAWKTALGLVVLVVSWRLVAGLVLHQTMDGDFFRRTDICADWLLWGSIVALAASTVRGRRWIGWLSQPVLWWVLVAGVVWYKVFSNLGRWGLVLDDGAAAALAVVVAGTVARPQRLVGRFLELGVMRWVGRISYSVYLWQQLFLVSGDWKSSRLSVVQRLPMSVAATLVCAAGSYYFIERPFLRLGHRLVGRTGDRVRAEGSATVGSASAGEASKEALAVVDSGL